MAGFKIGWCALVVVEVSASCAECKGICLVNNCKSKGLDLFVASQTEAQHAVESFSCHTHFGEGFRVAAAKPGEDILYTAGYTLFEGTWVAGDEYQMSWDLSALSGFNVPVKMTDTATGAEKANLASETTCGQIRGGVFPCDYGQKCGTRGEHAYFPDTCPGCTSSCCDHIPGGPAGGDCGGSNFDPMTSPATVTFC